MRANHLTLAFLAMLAGILAAASPAAATFTDLFLYTPTGDPLAGKGSWLPLGVTSSRITVNGGSPWGITLRNDWQCLNDVDVAYVDGLIEGGQVTFKIDVRAGQFTSYPPTRQWWSLTLYDENESPFLWWMGDSNHAYFHTPNNIFVNTIPFAQVPMRVDIDFTAGTIKYAFNGFRPPHLISVGNPSVPTFDDTFTPRPTSYIEKIEFSSFGENMYDGVKQYEHLYMNNLYLDSTTSFPPMAPPIPEPATMTLLTLCGIGLLRRRRT